MSFNHIAFQRRVVGLIPAILLFAACAGLPPGAAQAVPPIQAPAGNLMQSAEAGAVTVEITPLNLGNSEASSLDFEVDMNTHSVDLGVDLARLAVLKAGDAEVAASARQAPGGSGHHVTGKLIFPRASAAGKPILEGVTRFTLVIRNLARVPERSFTWELR